MYKNWLKEKIRERKEVEENKKKIDDIMSKWTAKDWYDFKTAEFDIVVEPNKEAEERMEREEEKTDQIIDGSFWNLEKPDFEELSDEEIGKRGKELLKQLKPFYRKDLLKTFSVQSIQINITKEIKKSCSYNSKLYEIKPESWSSDEKIGYVIDCDGDNIYYKPKADKYYERLKEARKKGLLKNHAPSIAIFEKHTHVSMRELYEERIEEGLDHRKLKDYAYSNDILNQIFFLYVIKRAQKQDEIAAKLIYQMYENAVIRKAEYWIKSIEEKRSIKFKQDSELGRENVRQVAKVFLNMLITGDDPEAIFEQIKKLDDPRNIETYFTRKLGSKLKILIKIFGDRLREKAKEYNEYKKLEGVIGQLLDMSMNRTDKNELIQFMKKIETAREIAKNPKKKQRTTYRDFINPTKLNDRIKQLYSCYCESEDFLIAHKIQGFPSLDNEEFNQFSDEEKSELEKIKKEADSKASFNEYDDWHTYREFLDKDNFTENEKRMFEIYTSWEDFLYTEYYPRLGMIRLDMQTFSNPYSWFSAINWFNDKIYKAVKNKNFTNWLLGGKKNSGALIELMNNWLRSANFMRDTKKGLFKDELIEGRVPDSQKEVPFHYNENSEKIGELVSQKIEEYISKHKIKERSLKIIEDCFRKMLKLNDLSYDEIAGTYGITRRQVIRIWKEFEEWLNIK